MTAVRLSAEVRREQVLLVALKAFARGGLHGTPTEAIARESGISHAYLFRLYPTKLELFLACVDRAFDRTEAVFRENASGVTPEERLERMGRAYGELLSDRDLLLGQLHAYAACGDDAIRERVRTRFAALVGEIRALSGAEPLDVQAFVAHGMLLNVAAAMGLPEIADSDERCWGPA